MKKTFYCLAMVISIMSSTINAAAIPADTKFESYIPLLMHKNIAVFANNTSQVESKNLIQVLQEKNINVAKIFTPEHGFTGSYDAGAKVADSTINGIPLISLYGKKTKPTAEDLKNIDLVIFDIQDVGVRYYTYISSLQRLMEALAVNNIPLIILDRPNPNAYYIDGPILSPQYKSFVGLQPIPIVYGMTIGEYAKMLVGENWLDLPQGLTSKKLSLTVITMDGYNHQDVYAPTIKPSPNLPNLNAIYWYPSLGWFEGTKLSVGRGTEFPFQVLGSPKLLKTEFTFTPQSTLGASNPPLLNQQCYGWNLVMTDSDARKIIDGKIDLSLLINSYKQYPNQESFFTPFFDKLAGSNKLRQQIMAGLNESAIRASWQPDLNKFKQTRNKYLLYP